MDAEGFLRIPLPANSSNVNRVHEIKFVLLTFSRKISVENKSVSHIVDNYDKISKNLNTQSPGFPDAALNFQGRMYLL